MAPLAPEQEWLDQQTTWRKTLCDELLACPQQPRTDHELGTQQNLKLSIITIDRGPGQLDGTGYCLETLRLGHLMREAGYVEGPALAGRRSGDLPWYGSVPQVERRIKEWTRQRDEAQAMLDDALLDDDARAKRDAESAARVAESHAAPQRKTRGDGTQYDKYPDGRMVEV